MAAANPAKVDTAIASARVRAAAFGFAEIARRGGALKKAKELYGQIAGAEAPTTRLASLRGIFTGAAAIHPQAEGEIWPTPFVHVAQALPPRLAAHITNEAIGALAGYAPAQVDAHNATLIDPSSRKALVLTDIARLAEHFLPRLSAILETRRVVERLGVRDVDPSRIDLQATCHIDGSYFRAHRDAGPDHYPNRVISFAYYFHQQPRGFEGGDLLLYDCSATGAFEAEAFTRVTPEHNSLVLFPSSAVHEVETVIQIQPDPSRARFALVGWIDAPL